jgi:acetyltransferase-like isoleucine patch superfamily enzyme
MITNAKHLTPGIEFINLESGVKPEIADNVIFNGVIDCSEKVIIEKDVFTGHMCWILTNQHDPNQFGEDRKKSAIKKPVTIKEGAWLATGCIILGGVTIGKNAVVGAGAVVNKDVPDFALAVGVPAKIVKYYNFNNNENIS